MAKPRWGTVVAMATTLLVTFVMTSEVRYRGAVYEHALIPPWPPARQPAGALRQMQRNLDVYRHQAAQAKRKGAQLVVFPEDGLYGSLSRSAIRPFLETVPDPRAGEVNPCLQRVPDTEVQTALSCVARDFGIHLVANMGDRQPCVPHAPCPSDGHWQYNTDVAFGPDGRLLARYHKIHLYGESQFDPPLPDPYNDAVTFNTTFGVRFGLATCFDLLFRTPAVDLVEKHGVRDLAFPTAWMDAPPLLSAVGFHSAFARALDITVLAANLHEPLFRMHGSGLYSHHGALAFYYSDGLFSPGRLLVADILSDGTTRPVPDGDSTGKIPLDPHLNARSSVLDHLLNARSSVLDHPLNARSSVLDHPLNARSPVLDHLLNASSSVLTRNSSGLKYLERAFSVQDSALRLSDNFTFIPLDSTSGQKRLCWQKLCCSVDYKFAEDHGRSRASELYALGVFWGYESDLGTRRCVQVCLVTRCPEGTMDSCGQRVSTASSRLESLSLRGQFLTRYVFPELLVDQGGQLSPAPGLWNFTSGAIVGTPRLPESPLVATALYGRCYDKDTPVPP